MFDGLDTSGVTFGETKKGDAIDRSPGMTEAEAAEEARREDRDAKAMREREQHARLLSFYQQELDRQSDNRIEMAIDEDFYDNDQWSEQDKQTLKERGQMALVYNVIASTVNWVTGSEKRARVDFRILPRRKDASKPAERKTQLLKYISDVNRSPFHSSRAFEDAVHVGIGWLECGVQDDDDGEPVYDRYECWRNVVWDSACTEKDLSDARYLFRHKWVDEDVANALVKGREAEIRAATVDHDHYDLGGDNGDDAMDSQEQSLDTFGGTAEMTAYKRGRLRLIECWFRMPTKVKRLRGGEFNGDILDEQSAPHMEAVQSGQSIVVEKVMMRMHYALITTKHLLHIQESPYRHNLFPLSPIWCYRRGRDGLPYGMIRGMRGIQDDINKRASKALHILSTNKTIMDEGAVDDIDAYLEEVSRPDAVIVKKAGKDLVINAERDLAAPHLELMSRSIQMIQSQSGVTDENMGRQTNATSGKAIQSRQDQGAMATAGIFDNLRFAAQVHGEKKLSLVEQFFTDEKSFRITNMRGSPEYVTVNDGLPENDITRSKADYIISEQDWRASVRQAQTEELVNMLTTLAPVAPQIALVMIDLIVEGMDVPSRDELVRRIREVTGMRDPDADGPTPEEQAKAQAQAEDAAMQKAMLEATIAEKQASAALKAAGADKAKADVQNILAAMAGKNVETQVAALEAALAMLMAPAVAPVADGVLHEAGFVSRGEQEDNAMLADAEAQRQAAAQQQAAMEQQQAPPMAPDDLPAMPPSQQGRGVMPPETQNAM